MCAYALEIYLHVNYVIKIKNTFEKLHGWAAL